MYSTMNVTPNPLQHHLIYSVFISVNKFFYFIFRETHFYRMKIINFFFYAFIVNSKYIQLVLLLFLVQSFWKHFFFLIANSGKYRYGWLRKLWKNKLKFFFVIWYIKVVAGCWRMEDNDFIRIENRRQKVCNLIRLIGK